MIKMVNYSLMVIWIRVFTTAEEQAMRFSEDLGRRLGCTQLHWRASVRQGNRKSCFKYAGSSCWLSRISRSKRGIRGLAAPALRPGLC